MKTWTRILVCGVICGAVWVVVGAVLVEALGREFLAAASRGAGGPGGGPWMFALNLAAGLWAMWMYSLVRTSVGPGLKSAAVVGVAWWILASLQSAKLLMLDGVTGGEAIPFVVALLPAMILATLVGAWFYDRQGSKR